MIIKSVSIKNFKTFDTNGITVTLNDMTALVGENSSGKSNVLEALDIFFNYSKGKIKKESFHHEDFSNPIEIEIIFNKLNKDEKEKFSLHLGDDNESLTITQIISNQMEEQDEDSEDSENQESVTELNIVESKHGTKWSVPEEYDWLNCLDKPPAKAKLTAWWKSNLTIGELDIKSFFKGGLPSQEEYQNQIRKLWDEGKLPRKKFVGDSKVLGWSGILKGNLPKYFYIPALKNIIDDLKVSKTSPFGTIISFLTNEIGNNVKEELENKTKLFINEVISTIDLVDGKSKIEQINRDLNQNIGIGIDCELNLQFTPPKIDDLIIPKLFGNDGFNSELVHKGHGMQRLAIFALLRTYYQYKNKAGTSNNFIIGIEEPEIYLHPPLKRATYSFLRTLSESGTQILYTTHDSYFLKVETFEEIRIFRKEKYKTSSDTRIKTEINQFSISELIEFYKKKYNIKNLSELSLKHRFYHICDESKNEGFFSKKVILIEGETEKYALPIYFKNMGFDLDINKISIISAGSVDTISYLLVMFNEFKIPCYVIFDGDKPEYNLKNIPKEKEEDLKNKSNRNKELFTFIGIPFQQTDLFFPPTMITENAAVWETDFETEFHKKLKEYDTIKGEAKRMYGSDSKPLTGRFFAEKICTDYPKLVNPHIDTLIENIKKCEWKQYIVKS
ncbi:ATP-dependent nuclease [Leptospira kanakyensis]|uniref:ATP-dependent nuclease n=1 Tax=Leptospira kanakyensis TaxID=2484968 RepID=UPI00223C8EF4|nr:AAA family ATPase [Leptospira kanakyensis]MCW7471763.1 ATP-dependent endonuclease [Leptospira kanakyensis]